MTNFSKFSEEMVVQILSKLPPKSLIRFTCLHKSWYTLIKNPSFVANNLFHSKHNKFSSFTCILFKSTILKDINIEDVLKDGSLNDKELLLSLVDLCNSDDGDDHNFSYVVQELSVPLPLGIYPFSLEIAGYCDGIICLCSCLNDPYVDNIVLCNPAIKEFKLLPKSCLILPPNDLDDYDALESSTNAVGFGYDSKAKDYKVVRIVEFVSEACTQHPTRVEVYTLGANSWREIKTDIESSVFWSPSFQIYFQGIYYWWAFAPRDREVILSFNMDDELFHELPVPDCFDEYDGCYRSLAILKESIVLLIYQGDSEVRKSFDIWTMDESDSVKGLWTKYLTIGPVDGIEIPLVFWKSNQLLMATTNGRVASYNLGTQMVQYFTIHGMENPAYIQAVAYINSIISVMGDNKLEGTDTSI